MLPLCYAAPPPPLAEKSLSATMKVPGLKTNIRLTKLAQEISWCVRDIQTFFVKMIEADFFSLNLKGNRSRVPGPGNGRCLLFRRIGEKSFGRSKFLFSFSLFDLERVTRGRFSSSERRFSIRCCRQQLVQLRNRHGLGHRRQPEDRPFRQLVRTLFIKSGIVRASQEVRQDPSENSSTGYTLSKPFLQLVKSSVR